MNPLQATLRWPGAALGLAAAAYAGYVGVTWTLYGNPARPKPEERDDLLDRFMAAYEVAERHHIRIAAPAATTFAVARDMNPFDVPLIRAVFKGRELIFGATPNHRPRPEGLLEGMQALGWVVLAEAPGHEVIVGAVTRPWEPNVTFRSIPADTFAAFCEPGYVKIVWTLRADPIDPATSIFRTETRAVATDAVARVKFRRYWSLLSPGILLIRRMMLGPLKAKAEAAHRTYALA